MHPDNKPLLKPSMLIQTDRFAMRNIEDEMESYKNVRRRIVSKLNGALTLPGVK